MAKSKAASPREAVAAEESATTKMKKKPYEEELARLQLELIKLQEWVKHAGLKVVVIFEGRDTAGKGGMIKRITELLNPRRTAASLPSPHRPTVSAVSGISSAISRTCLQQVRSCCSIAVGTTASASSV